MFFLEQATVISKCFLEQGTVVSKCTKRCILFNCWLLIAIFMYLKIVVLHGITYEFGRGCIYSNAVWLEFLASPHLQL